MNKLLSAWSVAVLMLLAACGGDGGGSTEVIDLTPRPPPPAGCSGCAPGVLTGVAAVGAPLAAAEVRVFDAAGRSASGITGADGRYRIALGELQGSLIVQVDGLDAGMPVRLHALQSAEESAAGQRALHLTPLTELIAAQVLGAPPQPLLAQGTADHRRIVGRTLQQAEARVAELLRPLLDAAGLPAVLDLRGGEFAADGSGIDAVLDQLRLEPAGAQWRIGVVGSGWLQPFDPAAPVGEPLQPPSDGAALEQQRQQAQAGVSTTLQRLVAAFGSPTLPEAGALAPLFAADFRHAGLDATAYIERVLLRRDAPAAGGFDLQGLQVQALRVIDLRSDGAALARWLEKPRAPFAPRTMRMWFRPGPSGWQMAGDGTAARIGLRHALLLAPTPMDEAALQALPGLQCLADGAAAGGESCRITDPRALPVPGVLDLGARGDGAFGVLALFRAATGSPTERLAAAAAHTQHWGAPGSRLQRTLLFEVDAREIDPRVARVRIAGGALPAAGVHLLPPSLGVNGPLFEHWPLAVDEGSDWAGLPWGWCAPAVAPAECSVAWAGMQLGTVLRFELLDAGGSVIETLEQALPPEPAAQTLQLASASARAARFDTAAADVLRPDYAQVLALGDALRSSRLRWTAPREPAWLQLRLHWQRADTLAQDGTEDRHQRLPLQPAAGTQELGFDARPGWASTWWSARLDTTFADGLRIVHAIAPTNPR